ncbi:hypothetical protein E2C01_001246 [Portunus trituberculatus]|uniref:Uncharacterized protein n=1 Tax=Portunus trituberculatus TaxID=210409 RepID=A0A5B7CHC0_PORTR|nr:hypothetical protein [Portunus trituberculatus]
MTPPATPSNLDQERQTALHALTPTLSNSLCCLTPEMEDAQMVLVPSEWRSRTQCGRRQPNSAGWGSVKPQTAPQQENKCSGVSPSVAQGAYKKRERPASARLELAFSLATPLSSFSGEMLPQSPDFSLSSLSGETLPQSPDFSLSDETLLWSPDFSLSFRCDDHSPQSLHPSSPQRDAR